MSGIWRQYLRPDLHVKSPQPPRPTVEVIVPSSASNTLSAKAKPREDLETDAEMDTLRVTLQRAVEIIAGATNMEARRMSEEVEMGADEEHMGSSGLRGQKGDVSRGRKVRRRTESSMGSNEGTTRGLEDKDKDLVVV